MFCLCSLLSYHLSSRNHTRNSAKQFITLLFIILYLLSHHDHIPQSYGNNSMFRAVIFLTTDFLFSLPKLRPVNVNIKAETAHKTTCFPNSCPSIHKRQGNNYNAKFLSKQIFFQTHFIFKDSDSTVKNADLHFMFHAQWKGRGSKDDVGKRRTTGIGGYDISQPSFNLTLQLCRCYRPV